MIRYGDSPVPWAVMWSAEDEYFVGECPWFRATAICQKQAHGEGVPRFGSPNVSRQRKVLALGLCDLCAKSLRNSTKLSMSNFGGEPVPGAVLTQSEPLLHVACAKLSFERCPALRRQAEEGRLGVRQVYRYRPRGTTATPEERARHVPDYHGPDIVGLAVLDIMKWEAITPNWAFNPTG